MGKTREIYLKLRNSFGYREEWKGICILNRIYFIVIKFTAFFLLFWFWYKRNLFFSFAALVSRDHLFDLLSVKKFPQICEFYFRWDIKWKLNTNSFYEYRLNRMVFSSKLLSSLIHTEWTKVKSYVNKHTSWHKSWVKPIIKWATLCN